MRLEVTGMEALEKTFDNFARKDKRNILISAFRKATRPTIDAAKANLAGHRKSGNLIKSVGFSPIRDEIGAYIGARIRGGFRGYHGFIVEEGTVARFRRTKNNAPTGKMKYTGFWKKATDSTERQVMNTVASEWYKAIEKFIVK